jgi:hypothetical protein
MKKITFLLGFLLLAGFSAQGQLAKVFVLGEGEERYEQLTSTYTQTLLGACQNDIEVAFGRWLDMMRAMDAHADKVNFNLKGVKVWFHVFWSENGAIDHLGFLLRPDSRHVEVAELRAFFSDFIAGYQFNVRADRKFSHYTGATFPTISEKSE